MLINADSCLSERKGMHVTATDLLASLRGISDDGTLDDRAAMYRVCPVK